MSDQAAPQPIRPSDAAGWFDLGPRDIWRDLESPDALTPPSTDSGTLANMKFSFSDAHQRLEKGGWAREVTNRELPSSQDVAGVNMALEPGAYRELHWHKEAEWGLMLVGNARVTSQDESVELRSGSAALDTGPGSGLRVPPGILRARFL